MDTNRGNICVVLCGVRESGNVGSVCRAMKTMGVSSLVLADCPDYEEDRVRMLAVHAYDIYENAVRCATLQEALSESALSAGFTRRKGEKRKDFSLPLKDFTSIALERPGGLVSLVFGNEKNGLSDEELACCSLAVHIPTSEDFPSLNVAQAVQIACYEFFVTPMPDGRGGLGKRSVLDGKSGPVRMDRALVETKVSGIAESLSKAGFFRKSDDSHVRRFLRDLCERAYLEETEIDYLARLFKKVAALSTDPSPRRLHKEKKPKA
jgi:tRNA/rRNA methyltransferase